MSDEEFAKCWAFLVGVIEQYYQDRDGNAFLKMMKPDAIEALAQLAQRYQKLGSFYSRLKESYDERAVRIDKLATEQSRLLAENHTLRIELRDANEKVALLSRSRTVTK